MSLLQHPGAIPVGDTSYDVGNSIKLERDNSERLKRTVSSTGDRQKGTISVWVKRVHLSAEQYVWESATSDSLSGRIFLRFQSDDTLRLATGTIALLNTNRKFRDPSAWYHIVIAIDTTQSTAGNRFRMYINGVEETSFSTDDGGNQNEQTGLNVGELAIGQSHIDNTAYLSAYLCEFVNIDGSQLDANSFGEFDSDSNIWKPKDVSGLTFGTNGAYLTFETSGALGDDKSGNGNDFALTNLTAIDQATDTCTNNFCVMNTAHRTNGNIRTQEGGTYVTTDGGSGWCSMVATMGVSKGKWYWEALFYDDGDAEDVHIGVAPANDPWIPSRQGGYYLGNVETNGSMGWDLDGGANYNQNGSWGNPSRGDKLMVALDMDNYKLYYGINGTWGNSANPANGTGSVTAMDTYWMSAQPTYLDFVMPAVSVYQGNFMKGFNFGGYCAWTISSGNADANGHGNFEYAPPSGFFALCSKNLAENG